MNDSPEKPRRCEGAATGYNEGDLEQKMAELGLSGDTCRFLRDLHHAEKVLNNAYDKTHQTGTLEKRISQMYSELYRTNKAER